MTPSGGRPCCGSILRDCMELPRPPPPRGHPGYLSGHHSNRTVVLGRRSPAWSSDRRFVAYPAWHMGRRHPAILGDGRGSWRDRTFTGLGQMPPTGCKCFLRTMPSFHLLNVSATAGIVSPRRSRRSRLVSPPSRAIRPWDGVVDVGDPHLLAGSGSLAGGGDRCAPVHHHPDHTIDEVALFPTNIHDHWAYLQG